MATRETRRDRGRRLGERLKTNSLTAVRQHRTVAGVSQRVMGRLLGCTQSEYWRFEKGDVSCDVVRLAEVAAILGLDLSIGFHPAGEPIRDKGTRR